MTRQTVPDSVTSSADARQQALQQWARQALRNCLGSDPGDLQANGLGGDASFRRYFRLQLPQRSLLLVDAPPAHENTAVFVQVAEEFRTAGMRTPQILAFDEQLGFLILEDFGDQLYLPCLQQAQASSDMARVDQLYGQALQALLALQSDPRPSRLPPYDRQRLEAEMLLFDEWFCGKALNMVLSQAEQVMLARVRTLLCDAALAQPQARVHRDYHSRNLMVPCDEDGVFREDQPPGIIDFQDAVLGAVSYDVVSLLRDCYIRWPDALVDGWVRGYAHDARQCGILPASYTDQQFVRDVDLMGLQRHIKVLGIFCRLALRDGKLRYLDDLPLVIDYVLDVSARYVDQDAELAAFRDWFVRGPAPAMRAALQDRARWRAAGAD